jgi:hypothetical protein
MASGMEAISSTMLSLLQPGDKVLIDHTLEGNSFAPVHARHAPLRHFRGGCRFHRSRRRRERRRKNLRQRLSSARRRATRRFESWKSAQSLSSLKARGPGSSSTIPLPRLHRSRRSALGPISSSIQPRNTSADMETSLLARFLVPKSSLTLSAEKRRRFLMFGLLFFTVASLACGLAQTAWLLNWAARVTENVVTFTKSGEHASRSSRKAGVRSIGRGCHVAPLPPTPLSSNFMRRPIVSEISSGPWRRRSR